MDAASWIAGALRIPTFIIGATIVSIATTLPEMLVSLMAAADGKVDMAIGNAVGSVTANTALIMAVAMLGMKIVCPRKGYWKQFALFIAAAASLYVFSLPGELNFIGCAVMALIFVVFLVQNVRAAKAQGRRMFPSGRRTWESRGSTLRCLLWARWALRWGASFWCAQGARLLRCSVCPSGSLP